MVVRLYLSDMAAQSIEQVQEALSNFADYRERNDVARAKQWLTAAERLISTASMMADNGSSLGYDFKVLEKRMAKAEDFIAARDTTPSPNVAGAPGTSRTLYPGSSFRD